MSMTLEAIPCIRIAGAANAWPQDVLGESAQLSNEQVYATLLGEQWQTALNNRDWDPTRSSRVFGVDARGWTRGTAVGSLELSIAAAEKALALSGFKAEDLDCIFSATCTPHQITSTLAGKVAKRLKTTAAAIDIRAGGAGGLDAMATAALYHSHGCKVSLVVSAEVASKYVGIHDLPNSLLFGDGASAMVLVSDPRAGESGLVGAVMGNAGWTGDAFTVPGKLPPTSNFDPEEYLFQAPDKVYRQCLADAWTQTGECLREAFPVQSQALSAMLPYAVTKDQVYAAAEPFGAPCDASIELLLDHGCIGCASPMAALALHWTNNNTAGKDQRGDVLGSMAVAGGISWSGLFWKL